MVLELAAHAARTRWHLAAALLLLLAVARPAAALSNPLASYDDEEQTSSADVVQQRRFAKLHEFSISGGIYPGDALYTGLVGSFRYVLHLSDVWAWEIGGGSYSFNLSTGADKRMLSRYNLEFTETERILVLGESNVLIKPIYGKFNVFNRWIWYGEPYLALGVALSRYTASWRVGPDWGAGMRFHLFDWLALHIDARHYLLWSGIPALPKSVADGLQGPNTLTNVFYLGAGVSFLVWDRLP